MSELFELLSSITNANATSFKSGYDTGFEKGYSEGYIAGLKKADEIREEVFGKDRQVKDGK